MASPLTGREAVCAIKKASTWRTAVECGADDGILFSDESLKQENEELLDDSLGSLWPKYSDQGKITASGTLGGYMRYEGLDVPLALMMGTAGAPTQQDSTAAYLHTLKLADNLDGLFATLAILKKSDVVFEYPTVKFFSLKLSGEMGGVVTYSIDMIPNKQVLDSSTNTASTMENVTYPDVENRIIMNSNTVFRINDKSGSALADGDKIYCSGFEFSFSRNLEGDLTISHDDIDEPGGVSFPEGTLTINFPRYDDNNHDFFADWNANTEKKMDISFTGKLIESPYYYKFTISMPHLRVINPDAPISGQGKIPMSMTLRMLGTDTAPAGMTGITKPFQLDIINKRSTDPLA